MKNFSLTSQILMSSVHLTVVDFTTTFYLCNFCLKYEERNIKEGAGQSSHIIAL